MCLDSLTDKTWKLTELTPRLHVSINSISIEMAVVVTHGRSMRVRSYVLQQDEM